MQGKPISHPIGRYYSSRTHPMPANTEAWIERLPMAQKLQLATALMQQCTTVFNNVPTLSVLRPTIQGDDAS
ncbi:hypothetical protein B9G53_14390 [Pseudanabaena sp. SR411]|uniref:hypothetical protein n=1 Tax=Pseudanabaena sp. SR411 TaxID=1980935 RepID=UPI000B999736|nr:hypothetical protein [Pseudanabaena sp. SR411]OYQ63935.1 hypothetical protein B9G53_14390 [Pseudanabaena sp. SR411]